MKVALELEFPDEQAASVMRQLQSLPKMTIRFLEMDAQAQYTEQFKGKAPLSEQEQHALLDQVFGSSATGARRRRPAKSDLRLPARRSL
ncbi:MAG: hypothetical protein WKG07_32735 [Hymenobacter sp.]